MAAKRKTAALGDKKTYVGVLPGGKEKGSYHNRAPGPAAAKAAGKNLPKTAGAKMKIGVRETGTDKVHWYNVQRIKLAKPSVTVNKKTGARIERKWKFTVKAA